MKILLIQHKLTEPSNHPWLDAYAAAWPGDELLALRPQAGFEGGKKAAATGAHPGLVQGFAFYPTHYTLAFYLNRLGGLMRRFKPDVIDLHDEPWTLTSAQTLFYRRLFAPQARLVVASAHNIFKHFPPPFGPPPRGGRGAAAGAYGCSRGVLEVLREKGYRGPLYDVPLAVNGPPEFSVPALHTLWSPLHPQREARIGYAGKLLTEKGIFVLLEAFAQLVRTLAAPVHLTYLGTGPEEATLRQRIAQLGLEDRVFIHPRVPPAEVPGWMKTQDVLVMPSQSTATWKEQFGRVVVEAFACGVPVAGSDSGSIPEVIGEAGLVFPEGDTAALAQAMGRMLMEPALRLRFIEEGLRRFRTCYTPQAVAQKMGEVYRGTAEAVG